MILRRDALPERQWPVSSASLVRRRRPDRPAGHEFRRGFGGQFPTASEYVGYRSLSDAQIEDLAEKVVEQIRLRGPFLSLSEFVNRQLSSNDDLALAGAIQTAINALEEDPMATLRDPANSLSDTTMPETDPKMNGVGYCRLPLS